jgi:hypothetical protein
MGGAAATALASPSALTAGQDINAADNFARVYVQRGGAVTAITDEMRLGVPPTVTGFAAEPASLKTPGSFAWTAGAYNKDSTKVTNGTPFATDANGAMIYTSGHGLVRADGPVGVTSGNILRMTSGVTTATDAPASGKGGGAEFTSVNGDIQLVAVKAAVPVPAMPTRPTTQPDLEWRDYDIAMKRYQETGSGHEPTRPASIRPITPSPEWLTYDKNVADHIEALLVDARIPGITIHAVGAIKIVSQSDISITANGKISQTSYNKTLGADTVTVHGDKRNHIWGLQTDFFMGMKSTFNLATVNTVTLGATTNTSLAVSFSMFLGGRIDLTFAGRLSCVRGWNKSVNLGGTISVTNGGTTALTKGLAVASFKVGRFTDIEGSDIKKVKVLDAKHVKADLAIKDIDLSKKEYDVQREKLTTAIKALSAENGNLDTKIKDLTNLM